MTHEQTIRPFCADRNGSPFFSSRDLKKATRISWFERFCLFFVRPQYQVDWIERHSMKYKMLFGKKYIIYHRIIPPLSYSCRHTIMPIDK